MSSEIAIKVENLGKCYHIYDTPRDRLKQFLLPRAQRLLGLSPKNYYREFWALKDVAFEVKKGETVGIIGRNGSGKSTLLQVICGTLNPTSGSVHTTGRTAALLELGSGFNPEFSGRENVYLNGAVLGLSKEAIDARFDDIAAFADIGQFIDQPVKMYSSGMMVRLAFAVAINVEADILIVDEALAVGDAAFQRKCMRKIEELRQSGVTLLFVSHDTETIKKICSEAVYLVQGSVREIGSAKSMCIAYERDLFGASKGAVVCNNASSHAEHSFAHASAKIDQELLVSNEKTYGDGRASIFDVLLVNGRGQKLNVLDVQQEFSVSYRVHFMESVIQPIFGMMITNREGVCIFGANTEGKSVSRRTYISGDEVQITFLLQNNLGPGIYYLTCGVHSADHADGLVYLQRRMDVLLLKSLGRDGESVSGMAQLYPHVKFLITEHCESNAQ